MKALLPLLLFVAVACGGPSGSGRPTVHYIAVDRSASARDKAEPFFELAIAEHERALANSGDRVEIYAFDDGVSEVYVGPPKGEEGGIAPALRAIKTREGRRGTNVGKLVARIEERMKVNAADDARVLVLTDCGTETMTGAEAKRAKEISTRWAADPKVTSFEVVGPDAGLIDDLRRVWDHAAKQARLRPWPDRCR